MGPNAGFRCVLMGDQSLLGECGEALLARGCRIVAVATESRTVAEWAARHGVPVLSPENGLERRMAAIDYDWFFSIANLRLVPETVWRRAARGAANFHDGPLPRYAGLNAPSWAILNGETAFGVTWHEMTARPDAGDIYAQQHFEVVADETAFTLNGRCFEAGLAGFEELLDAIEAGGPLARPQDLTRRTLFGKASRPSAGGMLRLDDTVENLDRLRRALDFGTGYVNPMVTPRLATRSGAFTVAALERLDAATLAAPGQALAVDREWLTLAVGDGVVRLKLLDQDGGPLNPSSVFQAGEALPCWSDAEADALRRAVENAARCEDQAAARLKDPRPVAPALVKAAAEDRNGALREIRVPTPKAAGDRLVAAILAFLARECGLQRFDVAYSDALVGRRAATHPGLFMNAAPLRVEIAPEASAADLERTVAETLAILRRQGGALEDLVLRRPGLVRLAGATGVVRASAPSIRQAVPGCALTFVVSSHGSGVLLAYRENQVLEADALALADRAAVAIADFVERPGRLARELPLMTGEQEEALLAAWASPEVDHDRGALMHSAIERQAALTPDAVALACGSREITYRELDRRADAVAQALAASGIGPDRLVGVHIGRSIDLVVAALGVLKSGGGYVPLDPDYPAERIAFMIENSGLELVLSDRANAASVEGSGVRVLRIDEMDGHNGPIASAAAPHNLAYVIYTSGSTGRPKGVMIEHRNVTNFFAGMDERVDWRGRGDRVWLAVTSLSFDISVLELFWTLSRGFKVVVGSAPTGRDAVRRSAPNPAASAAGMAFSLFYWGTDDGAGSRKYRLLLEGAKFADARGFKAVWTPERHFHDFGDPYPNPAVTGAAVAAVTRNLSIRAGSCVLPLHHPARVAEEWAVLDNISDGRVGLAFASGWMPEDFVLRPENTPPDNKAALSRDIEVVRRLWRGEAVAFPQACGSPLEVVTHPRPVQAELPVWVTSAGNPETFREAAKLGANVLTHLLGQSIAQVRDSVRIYREELVKTGHDPKSRTVTLMLHTLLGSDREEVRRRAREPMIAYLRSAAGLIKQYAWAFPAFKKPDGVTSPADIDLRSLSAEEMNDILDFAFERYFEDSGLFGTVADATARAAELRAIGVDEIACLIDFGVESEIALERLEPLAEVVAACAQAPVDPALVEETPEELSLGREIRRHGVTHLQCTPSMAAMLLQNPEDRAALAGLRRLYIGGEALTSGLLAELAAWTGAEIQNMYGPTETTIWSSTGPALAAEGAAPLGRPIVNTQFYVLDREQRLCPPGVPGELFIGGEGVARGYLNRPDLTDQRFRPNPFAPGRIYQTGDLVTVTTDGALNYLGRADQQVKLRGRRIELGEIEARLRELPQVREAVTIVREDRPGDARLVAYVRADHDAPDEAAMRAHLALSLPDYMVPAHFVTLDRFPLTPNAKIDRKALPRPDEVTSAAPAHVFTAPGNRLEREIAEVFRRVLGLERVGANDGFFALGGHSLLVVQAHRELKASVAPDLRITDLFRFPTVAALASHVSQDQADDGALQGASDRAALRRRSLASRLGASLPRAQEVAP